LSVGHLATFIFTFQHFVVLAPSSGPPPPVLVQPPQVFMATPVATTVIVSDSPHWTANPQRVICLHCRQDIVTRIKYVPGMLTWIIALVIFLFGSAKKMVKQWIQR
jgi:hypothetical protein